MRYLIVFAFIVTITALAQSPDHTTSLENSIPSYLLGPNDQVSFVVSDLTDEFADKIFRIDLNGNIKVPLAGRIHAAGLTVPEFEDQVQHRLERYVKDPRVVVTVAEFNSQPISVLGAVNSAGVKQVV